MNDFLVIILGSDENAYCIARLVHEEYKLKSLVLCSRILPACAHSKIIDFITEPDFIKEEMFVRTLKSVLLKKSMEYRNLIVLSCVEYYTELLVKNFDSFNGLIKNSFISLEQYNNLCSKTVFSHVCNKYGLNHPKTVIDEFPAILKPDNSHSMEYEQCNFTGKKKFWLINSKEEYTKVLTLLKDSGYIGKTILQEYIPGSDESNYIINSYSDAEGKVRAICLAQNIIEEYAPLLRGNCAAVITRDLPNLIKQAINFLEYNSYTGFATFDIKKSSSDEEFYFIELNARLSRCHYYAKGAGLNFIKIMIDDVVYGKKNDLIIAKEKSLWRNVPRYVLKKYVKNTALKKEIKSLQKNRKRNHIQVV